jgi:hypothetical protein
VPHRLDELLATGVVEVCHPAALLRPQAIAPAARRRCHSPPVGGPPTFFLGAVGHGEAVGATTGEERRSVAAEGRRPLDSEARGLRRPRYGSSAQVAGPRRGPGHTPLRH